MQHNIKTQITITIQPFPVPDHCILAPPAPAAPPAAPPVAAPSSFYPASVALSELSEETLAGLCRDFTEAVFKKAGKQQPPTCMPG